MRMTNREKIMQMSDEELAEYLFERGNGTEYCYGICTEQDNCLYWPNIKCEQCLQHIVDWLNSEVE